MYNYYQMTYEILIHFPHDLKTWCMLYSWACPLDQSHFRCSVVTVTQGDGRCGCSGFYLDVVRFPGVLPGF